MHFHKGMANYDLDWLKDSKHKKLISMMYPRYDVRNLLEMLPIRDFNIASKRDCDKIYVSTKIGQGTQCQCVFI